MWAGGAEIVLLHFDMYWTKLCDFFRQHITMGSEVGDEAKLLQIKSPRPLQIAMAILQRCQERKQDFPN